MSEPEQTNEAADGQSQLTAELERKVPTLVEFAEVLHDARLYPYQREILEAIERGERVQFCRTTGRQFFDEMHAKYLEMLRSNGAGKPTTEAAKPL